MGGRGREEEGGGWGGVGGGRDKEQARHWFAVCMQKYQKEMRSATKKNVLVRYVYIYPLNTES